jgi:hypothetical protein
VKESTLLARMHSHPAAGVQGRARVAAEHEDLAGEDEASGPTAVAKRHQPSNGNRRGNFVQDDDEEDEDEDEDRGGGAGGRGGDDDDEEDNEDDEDSGHGGNFRGQAPSGGHGAGGALTVSTTTTSSSSRGPAVAAVFSPSAVLTVKDPVDWLVPLDNSLRSLEAATVFCHYAPSVSAPRAVPETTKREEGPAAAQQELHLGQYHVRNLPQVVG